MSKNDRSIYTCIDDYGLGLVHNEIIRKIVETGVISGVTTFVGMKNFQNEATALKALLNKTNFQIGLHLDFIEFFPFMKESRYLSSDTFCTIFLIFQSLGLLNKKSITESIVKQLDIFQKSFGQLPDFIDGHYHLHQTKVPCDILIHILEEKEFAGWVRSTSMHSELNNLSIVNKIKKRYLSLIGMKAQEKILKNFRTNLSFVGYTDLKSNNEYVIQLNNQLEFVTGPTLFMLHPGSSKDDSQINSHDSRARDLETEWILNELQNKCKELNLNIIKDFDNLWIKT